ncbi:basic salivary proline-rich protein 4-like [Cavia porcellus]|uniref:basic salivary proline-rich protein 4-like n=1 Tax=Cavia porcellus TaxID=10141 RepID=UPI002FDF188E
MPGTESYYGTNHSSVPFSTASSPRNNAVDSSRLSRVNLFSVTASFQNVLGFSSFQDGKSKEATSTVTPFKNTTSTSSSHSLITRPPSPKRKLGSECQYEQLLPPAPHPSSAGAALSHVSLPPLRSAPGCSPTFSAHVVTQTPSQPPGRPPHPPPAPRPRSPATPGATRARGGEPSPEPRPGALHCGRPGGVRTWRGSTLRSSRARCSPEGTRSRAPGLPASRRQGAEPGGEPERVSGERSAAGPLPAGAPRRRPGDPRAPLRPAHPPARSRAPRSSCTCGHVRHVPGLLARTWLHPRRPELCCARGRGPGSSRARGEVCGLLLPSGHLFVLRSPAASASGGAGAPRVGGRKSLQLPGGAHREAAVIVSHIIYNKRKKKKKDRKLVVVAHTCNHNTERLK